MPTKVLKNEKYMKDDEYRKYLPVKVDFDDKMVWVTLADGRVIGNPLLWHPWLVRATPEQRSNMILRVYSVDWPDLDEGLDIEGMLRGIPSAEARRAASRAAQQPNP
jgi:hypothetical protein